jgi:putative ABC transport system permease protein
MELVAGSQELPRLARVVVRVFVPRQLRDEVEGDLVERYAEVLRASGRGAARRWLRWQLLALCPWGLGRSRLDAGNNEHVKDGGGMMTGGWGLDLRHGLRAVRLRPVASLAVVVTVALAVGATTSVYTVVDGVLLRPLPYPESDRLARVWQTRSGLLESSNPAFRSLASSYPVSVPTFNDWTDANTGFQSIGLIHDSEYVHQDVGGAEMLKGQAVTSGYFETLRISPLIGRSLSPRDDEIGAPRVVVLSEALWEERFGRGDVLGTTMTLDGMPHVVVGVMPAAFGAFDREVNLWTQLSDADKQGGRGDAYMWVVGRLANDLSLVGASERLALVQARLAEMYPDDQRGIGSRVEGLLDSLVGDVRPTLWFLLGSVSLVLVVATLNIVGILGLVGLSRRGELAVKAALGAGSGRLMRGLFLESAALASIGGVAGIALAALSLPVLVGLVPASVPRSEMISLSPGVLAFGVVLTALVTLLVGVRPAITAARTQPQEAMRSAARGSTTGKGSASLRSGMVVAEVALAFVLLVAAGLLGTSFAKMRSVDPGFATEGLVVLDIDPDPGEYPGQEGREQFARELKARFDAIPSVAAASLVNQVPLTGSFLSTTYFAERLDGEPERITVLISVGLENYLDLMEIPVLAGRGFTANDTRDAPLVGIVNEAMAQILWPDADPLGKRVRANDAAAWVEIIGVARNVRDQGLTIDPQPKLYLPAGQSARPMSYWVLRVRGDVGATIDLARGAVSAQSPTTPVRSVQILEETISASVAVPRLTTLFVVGLSALASALALLGLYGVVSFAVTQRTKEIGVRMALGANVDGIVGSVVGSGLKLAAAGVAVGLMIAWPAAGALEAFLFGVASTDGMIYATTGLCVLAVSGLATYLPARRAATVDPVSVLKGE